MNKKISLVLIIIICLFLTGCSDGESLWIEAFFKIWSTEVGISMDKGVDADIGKVANFLIDQAVGQLTNSDEATALDAVEQTLQDIGKADQIMEDAMLRNDPEALAKAQALRPEDVTYVEAEVATWVTYGNNAAAESAITKADNVTINAVMSGADCRTTRLNQLRIRKQVLLEQSDSSTAVIKEGAQNTLFEMAAQADAEIRALTAGEPSWFCAQFGKDN